MNWPPAGEGMSEDFVLPLPFTRWMDHGVLAFEFGMTGSVEILLIKNYLTLICFEFFTIMLLIPKRDQHL
jgi:hypothetical protein